MAALFRLTNTLLHEQTQAFAIGTIASSGVHSNRILEYLYKYIQVEFLFD